MGKSISFYLPIGFSDLISWFNTGMFLYARIVIDNVVDLISIEDIRRELKALPADLDSVYV